MGWQPNYQSEGRIFAAYILKNNPNGKIGVLFQNDDYGKDYLKGLRDGLGDKAKMMIIAELPYEPADPTVDSQIVSLKASGADIFFNVTTPKFAAQAIKKAAEIGWKPVHLLNSVSASVGAVIRPAGIENAQGIFTALYGKDPTDPVWNDDPGLKEWSPSWTSIIRTATRPRASRSTATASRARWCRCCSSAATISRATNVMSRRRA
jgi:branched-chain amino acid transport system substrate-binding protein